MNIFALSIREWNVFYGKESETTGKNVPTVKRRRRRALTFVQCYPCQTLCSTVGKDEQSISLFWKDNSREGVCTNNCNPN